MPLLWIVWACLTLILIGLIIYRSNLTRYEEDQLFLDDSTKNEHEEQNELLDRVKHIEPVVKLFMIFTGVMTVAIVGMYLWDAIHHFSL
jgi:hypothetical protein